MQQILSIFILTENVPAGLIFDPAGTFFAFRIILEAAYMTKSADTTVEDTGNFFWNW